MKKFKNSFLNILYYCIILSFLFPRGYAEINSVCRKIYTVAIWGSILIIWIQFFMSYFKMTLKKESIPIIAYFVIIIIITLAKRGLAINGYQKLIAYPSICLFLICNFKKNPKMLLNVINNVVLVLFILNQVVLRKVFAEQYHLTFLGHVQMVAQIGTLAVFCAMLFEMLYKEKKIRTIFIIVLSLYTMFTTDASSAIITSIILCIFIFLYKIKKYSIFTYNSKIYIIGGIILNIFIVTISIVNNLKYNNAIQLLDFSGRSFVWIEALSKFKNEIMLGYGIDGVLLKVFWNRWINPEGFNYAHNQILQNLIDGGLVGMILFTLMFFSFCKNIRKIEESKYQALINCIIVIFSAIMIFESTSLYCYMYMCFSIIYVLPYVIENIKEGENKNGSLE